VISYIPSLEFMRHLCGTYADGETSSELTVWRCGYGVVVEVRQHNRSNLVAVIGADSQGVECYALLGLPNAIRLSGELKDGTSIEFNGTNYPFGLSFANQPHGLQLLVSYEGALKAQYTFVKNGAQAGAPPSEA
jgi:hypothetical protein